MSNLISTEPVKKLVKS